MWKRHKIGKKILLLDIDGVILPFASEGTSGLTKIETSTIGTVYLNLELISYLKSLSGTVEIWIASSWQESGVTFFRKDFGIECRGSISFNYSAETLNKYRWGKQPALDDFFKKHKADELVLVDDAGHLYQGRLPKNVNLLVPDGQRGIGIAELKQALES